MPVGPQDIHGFQIGISKMLYMGVYPCSFTPNILEVLCQFTQYQMTHSLYTKQGLLDKHYHTKCPCHQLLCQIFPVIKSANPDDPLDLPRCIFVPIAVKFLANALQATLGEHALAIQHIFSTLVALNT